MADIKSTLLKDIQKFDFYQTIKIWDQLQTGPVPWSQWYDYKSTTLKIKARVFLDTPASKLEDLSISALGRGVLKVNFMGLGGRQGPLPLPYTEMIQERMARRDYALVDFLDIFNHRFSMMTYALQHKVTPHLAAQSSDESAVGECLEDLRGDSDIQMPGLGVYTGHLWSKTRSREGLAAIIRHYFKMKVRIESLSGRFMALMPDNLSYLGRVNHRLGQNAVLGQSTWQACYGIQILIFPSVERELKTLLPGQRGYERLAKLVRRYLGPEPQVQVVLRPAHPAQPPCILAHSLLSYSSFLPIPPRTVIPFSEITLDVA